MGAELVSYLLFELLVDRIQCVLDCYSLEVAGRDLKPERPVKVDLLDGWSGQELLEDILVFYS